MRETFVEFFVSNILWNLTETIILAVMARVFLKVFGKQFERKHEIAFWVTCLAGGTLAMLVFTYGLFGKDAMSLKNSGFQASVITASKLLTPLQTTTNSVALGTVSSAAYSPLNNTIGSGTDMAFVLHVSNSGRPSTAWGWRASIILPDGKEVPGSIPSLYFGDTNAAIAVLPTVVGSYSLTKDKHLLEALSFNPMPSGGAANEWLIVHFNGIDTPPAGSRFVITFEDVYGRQTKIDHLWTSPPPP